jgi:hypothetical protein
MRNAEREYEMRNRRWARFLGLFIFRNPQSAFRVSLLSAVIVPVEQFFDRFSFA